METILLSVCVSGRREELTDMLGETRELICADSPEAADVEAGGIDLWVLDRRRLHELGIEALQAYKDREPSVASPVLLLAPGSHLTQLDPALWSHVDDILGTPLRQAELKGRVRALLRTRQYSVEAEEARKELKKSRDLLNRVQDVAGVGGWEYHPERDQIFGTDHLAQLLGRSEVDGFGLAEGLSYYFSRDREKLHEAIQHCLDAAEPFGLELPFFPEEGQRRWGRVRGEPWVEDGEVVRVVGTLRDITEQKEAEKGKERSREQLAAAERIANLGSWERDLREGKLYWSDETYRVLGLSPEEPITFEEFIEVIHPEDRDRLLRQQERLLEDGTPIDIEHRICRPDGEERIVQAWGEVVRRDDGTPVRILGATLDVTDRRRREQKIERLRKKYEGLLQGAPDAIFVADAETGRIVEANRAAAELLETSVEELVGCSQAELHPPEERDRYRAFFEEHIQAAKEGRETFNRFEDGSPLVVVTESGERIPVEISATPVELEDQEYFMGIVRDVRRRRRAQRRRRIFEQAVQHSGDAIFITDPDGKIQYLNPATEEITGYEEEELIGGNPRFWQSDETPEETRERFWNAIQGGKVCRNTFRNETKEGALIELDQVVIPIEDPSGEIQYYVSMGRDMTEQKEAQRQLQEREERLRGLANSIPGVIYQFYARPDGTYGVRFVSDRAEEILGIPADPETFGDRFLEHIPDSVREDLLRSVDEAVEAQEAWRREIPFDRPDGTRIWLMGVSTPVERDIASGKEVIFNGVLFDVTERKRQEKTLEERQEKVEALYETTRRLLEARSPEAVADRVHEELEDIFDYAAISISFVEGNDIVPVKTATREVDVPSPERRPLAGNSVSAQTLRAGETVVFENVHALENEIEYGEMQSAAGVPIGDRGTIIIGQVGAEEFEPFDLYLVEVLGTYASIVLDRLDREREMQDTRRRMELTLRQTGSIIFEIDLETRKITRRGFGDFLNSNAEELPPWDAFAEEAVHPEDRKTFCRFYRELEEGRKDSGTLEYRTSRQEEEVRWVRETVFAEEKEGRRWLRGLAQEVTREKKREQKLIEAKEEAEEAARLESAMLANMSHEIRTPLTSIIGFAEVLGVEASELHFSEESQLPHYADLIEQSGKRLLETLDGVLNLSKLEAGRMELSAGPVDLVPEVRRAAKELRSKAEEEGIDLRLETEPTRARADEGGVQIILQNLVSNAIKYTEAGEVRVRAYRENGWATLEVEDTGIGMDPEQVQGLFEPFRQASEGLGREYEGTGVGLAVTKEATEQMGGRLEVETEKNMGSRFVVRLPMVENWDESENGEAESRTEEDVQPT